MDGTFERLESQLRLRPKCARLQHVGDRRQPDAMTLLRRVEAEGRLFDRRALGISLRASSLVVEQCLLGAEDRVLYRDVVREIDGDRGLPCNIDVTSAPAKIEHEV